MKQHYRSSQAHFLCAIAFLLAPCCWAQQLPQNGQFPIGQGQGPFQGVNQQNAGQAPQGNQTGQQGGGQQADFDSLIDLIQSTVAFDSWAENGTGEGEVQPFVNGVYVDAAGTLKFAPQLIEKTSISKVASAPRQQITNADVRKSSPLRYVSLNRLEAAIDHCQQSGQSFSMEMLTLAGLQRIEFVVAYPETGDLVFAGPAGDWQILPDGKIVSIETGQPVVRLDDLLTLWRRQIARGPAGFGCSITPRQAALAQTQEFVRQSNAKPIEPSQRKKWLGELRNCLGKQDVEFFGISPDSHVARTLLHADYHMKLIGMGIAEGVEGVESYLSTVKLLPSGQAPPMAVLRWWFALNYEPVATSADRTIFQLRGPGVKVLSENELLAARGQRVHTGQSEDLNSRFAESFTAHFEQICQRYPLYGELRNIFDTAFALSLVRHEQLTKKVNWQPSLLVNEEALLLPAVRVPNEVDTVINHRVLKGRHIVAGISGGVWLDTQKSLELQTSGLAFEKSSNTDEIT